MPKSFDPQELWSSTRVKRVMTATSIKIDKMCYQTPGSQRWWTTVPQQRRNLGYKHENVIPHHIFITLRDLLLGIYTDNPEKRRVWSANIKIHYLTQTNNKKSIPSRGDQFLAIKFLKWILATCRTPMSTLLSTMICNSLTRCWGAYWNCMYI